jgi:uncharacterized protein
VPTTSLTISLQTQRRFILGKQGLYPGRRWQGPGGVRQAIESGVVVQIDPLSIIARSHDIVLHSRVLGYTPDFLAALMYRDRAFFDYGGVVRVFPMQALRYWRVVMARVAERRAYLGEQNHAAITEVLAALRERGPLANRDFAAPPGQKQYWHASKTTAQALYYLWLKGEVMTHSRRGFERCFDLTERIVPPEQDAQATVDEAEAYFAARVFQHLNLADLRSWRSSFIGMVERPVPMHEAAERLQALLAAGSLAQVTLEGGPQVAGKDPIRYLLAEDLPLLEALQAGRIPDEWQPLGPTTSEEATFLAPLENVSARGRALPLFQFDYKWEVYKPVEQRRWGYYVLPILFGDRLVARFDSKMDRASRTLIVLGFWLEEDMPLDAPLQRAMSTAFQRFAHLCGAGQIEWGPLEGQMA